MDYETLDSDPESFAAMNGKNLMRCSPRLKPHATDIPAHLKTIQQEWKKRGLSFVEDDKSRLVS